MLQPDYDRRVGPAKRGYADQKGLHCVWSDKLPTAFQMNQSNDALILSPQSSKKDVTDVLASLEKTNQKYINTLRHQGLNPVKLCSGSTPNHPTFLFVSSIPFDVTTPFDDLLYAILHENDPIIIQ